MNARPRCFGEKVYCGERVGRAGAWSVVKAARIPAKRGLRQTLWRIDAGNRRHAVCQHFNERTQSRRLIAIRCIGDMDREFRGAPGHPGARRRPGSHRRLAKLEQSNRHSEGRELGRSRSKPHQRDRRQPGGCDRARDCRARPRGSDLNKWRRNHAGCRASARRSHPPETHV